MKLNVIKHQNGKEVVNFALNLDITEEVMSVINKLTTFADRKKIEVLSNGFPYEVINEGNINGFFSPSLLVLTSGNHIDITTGGINYQFHFSPSVEAISLPILAA